MSTGISISSINRIKELAEEKKYAEALEILDTQNLDKSINPQFLKISGEIFRENKRYYDSRRILLKAHEMAPQGTRIIAELIQLHLTLGHFELAEKYYEEYKFYSSDEDSQKEFVEYIMKKATGNDIKELASIIIPILERMPEDRWNFEAVLLYDKLDRKDKALEEAQYILENFKDSIFVKPVIEYIDDKLDVDKWFYVYPKEASKDDPEVFGELIERETKLLEKDHLMMYPPEPKILVEADDNDAPEVKVNNKDSKKSRIKKKKKNSDIDEETEENLQDSDKKDKKDKKKDKKKAADSSKDEKADVGKADDKTSKDKELKAEESKDKKSETDADDKDSEDVELRVVDIDAEIKKEREAALEKLLAKRLDKEAIKESAKQMAKAVNLDPEKTKEQVKNVTESVKDNVKKATETIGEVVGTTKLTPAVPEYSEEFVDGIIESVIEAPKKSVGEVLTNEELDALVPDSLEAMSADEVAEIEAKKEEQERLELEALEASLKREEEKKNKKNISDDASSEGDNDSLEDEAAIAVDIKMDASNIDSAEQSIASISFAELKAQFLADEDKEEEEEPLESLGFISVVQSDIDEKMENDAPEAAEILHRMIDNKEYYSGEDSRGFESKASYENHGFEVEDIGFNEYIESFENDGGDTNSETSVEYKVDDIFAEKSVLDFETISPEDDIAKDHDEATFSEELFGDNLINDKPKAEEIEEVTVNEPVIEESVVEEPVAEEPVIEESVVEEPVAEEPVIEEPVVEETVAEEPVIEEPVVEEPVAEEPVIEEPVVEEPVAEETVIEEPVVEETVAEEPVIEEPIVEETVAEEPAVYVEDVEESNNRFENDSEKLDYDGFISPEEDVFVVDDSILDDKRKMLRFKIVLTNEMVKGLLDLKESR